MIKNLLRSSLLSIIFFFSILLPSYGAVNSAYCEPNPPDELEAKLDKALSALFGAADYAFENFESSDSEDGGKNLNATISLSGESETEVSAAYASNRISSLELEFPEEAKLDLDLINNIVDGKLTNYIPDGLPLSAGVYISNFVVDFGDSGVIPKQLETTIGLLSDWDVLGAGSFTADGVELTFSISDPKESSRQITGELSGSALAGEIPISLSSVLSTDTEETSITGTIENLSLGSILKTFVPSESNSVLGAAPDLFKSLQLSSVELAVQPVAKALSFKANSSLGDVIMSFEKKGSSSVFLALNPADDFEFSQLSAVLQPLDAMDFSGSQLILSSKQTQIPISFLDKEDTSGDKYKVLPGLNLVTSVELPENMSELLGVTSVQLVGSIAKSLQKMSLSSDIAFDLELGSDDFTFDALTASLVVGPGDFEMSFTGAGSFQAGSDRVQLFGGLNLDIISQQVGFEAGLAAGGRRLEAPVNCLVEQPEWSEPFGIPGVGIRRLAIGASVGTTFPWLNELKFEGNMRVGTVPDQSNHICGAIATAVNIADFSDSMIIVEVQNLTIISMIDAFVEDAEIEGSLRDALETGIESAKLKVVPKEQELFGRTYQKGIALDSAKLQLLGVDALMGFSFSESGLKGYGSMDPLTVEEGGFTFFAITGSKDKTEGPYVSLGLDGDDPHFKLDGSVTVLEIQSDTSIRIDKSGFEFTTTGNVLDGALMATATISASDFTESSGIYAKIAFENKLQTMVADALVDFIKESTKANQATYSEAQKTLAETKGNNSFEQFWIDAAGETVTAFKEMDKAAAVAGAYVVEGVLEEALNIRSISFEGSVNSLTADVAIDIDMTIAGQDIVEQVITSINISEDAIVDLIVDLIGQDVIDAFASLDTEIANAFEDLGEELEAAFEEIGNAIVYAAEYVGEGIITAGEYIGDTALVAAEATQDWFIGSTETNQVSNGTFTEIPPGYTHIKVNVSRITVIQDEADFLTSSDGLELFGGILINVSSNMKTNAGATPYAYSRSARNSTNAINEGGTEQVNHTKDFFVPNDQSGFIQVISFIGEWNTVNSDTELLSGQDRFDFQSLQVNQGVTRSVKGFNDNSVDEEIRIDYQITVVGRRGPIPTQQQMRAAIRSGNQAEVNRLVQDGGTLRGDGFIEAAIQAKQPNLVNALLNTGNYAKTSQVELALSPQYYNPDIAFALLNKGANASSDALLNVVKQNKTDMAATLINNYNAFPKIEHLQVAVQNNNIELLKILDNKGNIPVTQNELQFVLNKKEIALADSFVKRGAGVTPAMITQAVGYNEIQLVNDMMKVVEPDQGTILAAANLNDIEMFKTVVRRVGLTNNQPIHVAIDKNNMEILEYGLRHGGTKNEALQYALSKNNKSAIEVALKKGASPTYAVDYAVRNKDMNLYKDLLTVYGADASIALQRSYDNGNFEMGKIALESGGEADNRIAIASKEGKEDWVNLLLEYNADPNLGMTGAVENQHTSIVKTLLDSGASAEDPSLIYKASNGNLEIVKYLVELGGADPEGARNSAIQANNLEMLSYLLDQGAQPIGLVTPAQNGWLPMVKLLVEKGADPEEGMAKAIEFDKDEVAIYSIRQRSDCSRLYRNH